MAEPIVCRRCGGENAAEQRFCGTCGASLLHACPSCGQSNPPSFRFCGSCGSALEGAEEKVAPVASEERRWATVLFGDLSGFTKLSEHMDPEDVTTLIDRCMTKLGEIVERFEGRVERVIGDEIMVVFGAPLAHEDDPERAVRTGLEMQRCAAEQTADFGGLAMRIGINTGEMMFAPVGPEGARQHTMMGDAVNTASRLETAAPLGGVLVGAATYEATKHAIRYDPVEAIVAKGKQEPVAAWLAVEPVAEPAGRPISEIPIIGRERELELMRRIWEGVVADGRPHLAAVIGPPGIGKSKLAREFTASLEGAHVVWGRSLPYGERAGGAFGQILRQLAGAFVTDDVEAVRAKLGAATVELIGAGHEELGEKLSAFLGVGSTQEQDRAELFAAVRRLIEALAATTPTVLVFEDLQWADASHLELIQWLTTRMQSAPVLLLTLTRPELLEKNTTWGGGMAAYTALPLGPLRDESVRELAHRLRADLDAGTLERIENAAGGNPLFVEELASWMSEGATTGPLPASVTSIVAARLDALPSTLRRVLLDASVIGLTFWRGSLEAVQSEDAAEALDELVGRDLIRRQPVSRVPDDEEFTFRHQVIQDVAYQIIPKAVRRERHEAVARFIEERVGSTDIVAAILARHWREAGDIERAIDYLAEAAEVAGRGWEQRESLDLLKQALQLVSDDDVARKRELNLKAALARQRYVHSVMDRAQILAVQTGDGEDHHEH